MKYIFLCTLLYLGFGFSPDKTPSDRIDLIVKLDSSSEEVIMANVGREFGIPASSISLRSIFKFDRIYLMSLEYSEKSAQELIPRMKRIRGIISAEEDALVELRERPNDQEYAEQWDMEVIQAPELWNFTKGGTTELGQEIVIAVIDEGFQVNHADLTDNLWINENEILGNELDDDGNGYVDDYFGANVRTKDGNHPVSRHGLSVSGIIGAIGNNQIGVTGLNWKVKLMLVSEPRTVSLIIEAYEYVLEQRLLYDQSEGTQGAFVVATNFSLGVRERFADEFPVWCGIYNTLGQAGILSVSATVNGDSNIDEVGDMPSTCTSDYLIVVNNTDRNDNRVASGISPNFVDLSAPGEGSFTIDLSNTYSAFHGTSASSPHVAGAIGLLYSLPCETLIEMALQNPGSTALLIKDAILNGVDPLSDLSNITVTGGRLNVFRSALQLNSICKGGTGPLEIVNIYPSPAREYVKIVYEAPDFDGYSFLVYDAVGRLVYREALAPPLFGEKFIELPVGGFSAGIYFASILNEDFRVVESFVVQ